MVKRFSASVEGIAEPLPGTRLLYLDCPPLAAAARPGQFLLMRCGEGYDPYLREALPIHRFTSSGVAVLFRGVSPGLAWLATRRVGEHLDILGPCGRGFALPERLTHLSIVYQGMGVAPLLSLLDRPGCAMRLVTHAPTAGQVYPRALLPRDVEYLPFVGLEQQSAFWQSTEESLQWSRHLCAAGPDRMLVDLQSLVRRVCVGPGNGQVQAWVERRLACGLGACQGCTITTQHGPRRVCADGPVFDLLSLILR
ncbi:MAG: iron-sulfur cluster-binding protein [Anaerolineae bacterium]